MLVPANLNFILLTYTSRNDLGISDNDTVNLFLMIIKKKVFNINEDIQLFLINPAF